jgi:hypothetical protein|nr:MAG TPA_asm: hypothetical protein [Caudoviricetes sp.]
MKSLIVDSFTFAFATIVVLVVAALYLGVPAGILSMICSVVSAAAAVTALFFLIVLKKTIEPTYATVETSRYRIIKMRGEIDTLKRRVNALEDKVYGA